MRLGLLACRTPDRAFAHVADMVDHRVERAMRLRAKGPPVRGIQILRVAHACRPARVRADAAKAGDLSIRRASPAVGHLAGWSAWNSGLCPEDATSPRFGGAIRFYPIGLPFIFWKSNQILRPTVLRPPRRHFRACPGHPGQAAQMPGRANQTIARRVEAPILEHASMSRRGWPGQARP